jgi:hypothetical protein
MLKSQGDAMNLKEAAQKVAEQGRYGDTMLAHITPEEARLLEAFGGSGTINPNTGLPEYFFRGFFNSIISPIVDVVEDVAGGVVGLVEDTAGNVESVVKQVGESPLLPVVANYFVPGSGAFIAAAQTLDQGGSLEDAIANGTKQFIIDRAMAEITGGTSDTTGIDAGDVIPTVPAQLEGLYPPGGTFNPPVIDTTGLDMGDVIPTTPIDQTLAQVTAPVTEPVATAPTPTNVVGDYFDPQKMTSALTPKDVLNMANVGLTAAAILNPPEMDQGTGATFYPLQPIPEDWKSPVYQTDFTPIDLNSIFGNQNLLANTQFATPMQPIQFAQAPTMQNLMDMIQGINFGQNATGDQSVKG